MGKIPVIHKLNGGVTSDRIIEVSSLSKLSLNNIPYYLTISQDNGVLCYKLKYFDTPDCQKIKISEFTIVFGNITGRIYSLSLATQENHISNSKWNSIRQLIYNARLDQSDKIIKLIKLLQEIDTVNQKQASID